MGVRARVSWCSARDSRKRSTQIVFRPRIHLARGRLSRGTPNARDFAGTSQQEFTLSFSKTAFYAKNVPNGERAVRLLLSIGAIAAALIFLSPPWSLVLAASALGFSLTGIIGYCPACALVGRRLEKR